MNRVWTGIVLFVAGAWARAGAVDSGLGSAPSTVAVNAPAISISRDAGGLKIAFTGVLQTAEPINGPWSDLLNVPSPFVLDPAGSQMFFRAREAQPESILAGTIQLKSKRTIWSDCFCENKQVSRASTGGEPNGAASN